jgi:hypothetical protein
VAIVHHFSGRTEAAVWLGLIHGTLIYGWHPFWAMFLLAAANAYIVFPALSATLADVSFSWGRRKGIEPGVDWVARVVRITALPPELASRLA